MANKLITNADIDTRYILYDGFNDYQVQEWLRHRGIASRVTSSGAIYASFIYSPNVIYVIRIREYVYIADCEIKTVRSEELIQEYLNTATKSGNTVIQNFNSEFLHYNLQIDRQAQK